MIDNRGFDKDPEELSRQAFTAITAYDDPETVTIK